MLQRQLLQVAKLKIQLVRLTAACLPYLSDVLQLQQLQVRRVAQHRHGNLAMRKAETSDRRRDLWPPRADVADLEVVIALESHGRRWHGRRWLVTAVDHLELAGGSTVGVNEPELVPERRAATDGVPPEVARFTNAEQIVERKVPEDLLQKLRWQRADCGFGSGPFGLRPGQVLSLGHGQPGQPGGSTKKKSENNV